MERLPECGERAIWGTSPKRNMGFGGASANLCYVVVSESTRKCSDLILLSPLICQYQLKARRHEISSEVTEHSDKEQRTSVRKAV